MVSGSRLISDDNGVGLDMSVVLFEDLSRLIYAQSIITSLTAKISPLALFNLFKDLAWYLRKLRGLGKN